jgi:hypothetical protein
MEGDDSNLPDANSVAYIAVIFTMSLETVYILYGGLIMFPFRHIQNITYFSQCFVMKSYILPV